MTHHAEVEHDDIVVSVRPVAGDVARAFGLLQPYYIDVVRARAYMSDHSGYVVGFDAAMRLDEDDWVKLRQAWAETRCVFSSRRVDR